MAGHFWHDIYRGATKPGQSPASHVNLSSVNDMLHPKMQHPSYRVTIWEVIRSSIGYVLFWIDSDDLPVLAGASRHHNSGSIDDKNSCFGKQVIAALFLDISFHRCHLRRIDHFKYFNSFLSHRSFENYCR